MSNQAKNSNLNYLIDPTFGNVNILFVLLLKTKKTENLITNTMYQT